MIRDWSSNFSGTREPVLATLQTNCKQTSGTVWWTCLSTSNDSILDCRGTARSSRPAWWNSHRKTSAWWSWRENSGYIRQISVWISSFDIDSWETVCCSSNSVATFAWHHWIQIVPFALVAASIDRRVMRKTKWVCKSYVAILACCPTWWMALSCDWWWVVVFLQYITTSHVDAVERWCDHKTEIWYSEQKFMFTIIWNPSGFYVVDRLPNDTKMNSAYFVTNIFIPFISLEQEIFPRGRVPYRKRCPESPGVGRLASMNEFSFTRPCSDHD
jgi:hypothetical protein